MSFEFTPRLKETIRSATEELNAAASDADRLLREVSEWLGEKGPRIRVEGEQFADVSDSREDGGTAYTLTYDRVAKEWGLAADVMEYRYRHNEDGARIPTVNEYGCAEDYEFEVLQQRKEAILSLPRELKIDAVQHLDNLLLAIAKKAAEVKARVHAATAPKADTAAIETLKKHVSEEVRNYAREEILEGALRCLGIDTDECSFYEEMEWRIQDEIRVRFEMDEDASNGSRFLALQSLLQQVHDDPLGWDSIREAVGAVMSDPAYLPEWQAEVEAAANSAFEEVFSEVSDRLSKKPPSAKDRKAMMDEMNRKFNKAIRAQERKERRERRERKERRERRREANGKAKPKK